MKLTRKASTKRRHFRVRKQVNGSAARPRLAVFRSNEHIYAQVIDDAKQHTLVTASTIDKELKKIENGGNSEAATAVGKLIAERAIAQGIKQVVFDRGGNLYHGRVKALAEAARAAGLDF
jgi:large subunit ribosomal protein L18